ncbi:MAG: MFS transporter [Dehalococcoidia bacterium]|nr:MFS transporter [Dehalococcoidia bacterium]
MKEADEPVEEVTLPLETIGRWRSTFSSLSIADYRWYWFSTLGAFTAMQMSLFVQGLLIFELTNSAVALGLVSAAFGVPMLLFSLWGGAVVDRADKRNVLIVTQALSFAATLAVGILIALDMISFWHLLAASFINGLVLSFNLPGRQAILPQLVGRERIMNAVALASGAVNSSRIFAPAMGGLLVGFMGIDGIYFLIAAFYLASVLLLFMIPALGKPVRPSSVSVRSDIREGLTYIKGSPILLGLLVLAFVPVVFGMPYQMLMPVFAVDVLGMGRTELAFLLAMTGVGAVLGSMGIASLGEFRHKGLLLLVSCALFGAFLIFFAQSTSYLLSLFLLVAVGAANVTYLTANNTLLQVHCDDAMRGRVMSLYMMTIGLMPVGTLGISAIAEWAGAPLAVAAGGAFILVFALAMTLFSGTLRRL